MVWCEEEFNRYLYITDPGFLYVALGTIAANFFSGKPVWLMLVGPSGCGKTEMLLALAESNPEWYRILSDASRAAFLSGTSKREKTADATGGLLYEIAEKQIRFLIFKEYGSIIDQKPDDYNQISTMQREIWDGSVYRPVGSDGGKILDWNGKVGELAACTSRIDDVLEAEVVKGVRWVLWRYPSTSGFQEALKASTGTNPQDMREALSLAVGSVLNAAELEWGEEPRELTETENLRITRIAAFSALLQGAIRRDKYKTDEINGLPAETYPTRLGPALVRLYLGMERIGVGEVERWKQLRKVALDTIPALRLAVLREFIRSKKQAALSNGNGRPHSYGQRPNNWIEMSEKIRCGRSKLLREMEDMTMLNIINRANTPYGWEYELPQVTQQEMEEVIA